MMSIISHLLQKSDRDLLGPILALSDLVKASCFLLVVSGGRKGLVDELTIWPMMSIISHLLQKSDGDLLEPILGRDKLTFDSPRCPEIVPSGGVTHHDDGHQLFRQNEFQTHNYYDDIEIRCGNSSYKSVVEGATELIRKDIIKMMLIQKFSNSSLINPFER